MIDNKQKKQVTTISVNSNANFDIISANKDTIFIANNTISLIPLTYKATPKKRIIPLKYKLFLMLLPFLIFVFIFSYLPLYGWRYIFYDYRAAIPISETPFVKFKWFIEMYENEFRRKAIIRVLTNTFAMSGLGIAFSWLPLMFAVFLNEITAKRYKKFVQTITTIPNFISWVLVYSFAFMLLSVDNGLVNVLFKRWGWIEDDVNFLISQKFLWLKMFGWSTWKGLGWGAIMYLASIAGIDKELYEAAEVDGAGRFAKIWNITIPGLLPTYFVLLLLSISNLINNGIEQYWAFENDFTRDKLEVLDLYVYNLGFSNTTSIPSATIVGMFKTLVSITLLFIANGISKLLRGESIV